jgi:N-acetylneuraminic acid mutarotase
MAEEEAEPTEPQTSVQDEEMDIAVEREALPPLPWPKRVALVFSVLIVAAFSAVTWPRPNTAANELSDETDALIAGMGNEGLTGENSGWRALAPMTLARSRFALVAVPDGHLYAIAGETTGGITGAVERYDPATDQWTPVTASKPTRVSNVSGALIGDRIYVPGGFTAEGAPTTVVEAYDIRDEAWVEVESLPRPLSSYALALFQGRLYLFGGKDDRGYVASTFIYDPEQDSWQEGPSLPTRRAYAAAATLGSRIYVIGGYDGQREQPTCELYRPEQDTWESCEPLTLDRGGFGLAGVADRLFAVGGGWSNYLWFNEKYNPTASDWTPFETPVGRQWLNLAVSAQPDRFYVAGGWNGDYLNGVWEYVVLKYKIFVPAAE